MRKLALLVLAAAACCFGAESTLSGYLVDISCGAKHGQEAEFGANHSRNCLRMCKESGYGLLTDDKKLIKFDKAGNEKALQFLSGIAKDDDIKVSVTGTINDGNMSVEKIELK
jgi:hypothetical protein